MHHDFILFDLDGTLSDPLVGIGRSINYALSQFGYAERELHELAVHIGSQIDQAFKSITGVHAPSILAAMVGKYRERYGAVGYAENVLYPGIVDALDALGEAGIPLGICTSKRTDFAERILAMFGLRSRFRFISGGDVGVDKWRQIETLLAQGLISASTVMVGDRAIDLVAAHRNGLSAAGVLWGHGSREELEREQPRYLLSEPSGLLHFAAQRGSERQACRDAHTRELDCRTLPIDGGADRYDDPACARTQTRCSPEAGSRH